MFYKSHVILQMWHNHNPIFRDYSPCWKGIKANVTLCSRDNVTSFLKGDPNLICVSIDSISKVGDYSPC